MIKNVFIFLLLSILMLLSCSYPKQEEKLPEGPNQYKPDEYEKWLIRMAGFCECIHGDPNIKVQAIKSAPRSSAVDTILEFLWFREENPEVQKAILIHFSKLEPHKEAINVMFISKSTHFTIESRKKRIDLIYETLPYLIDILKQRPNPEGFIRKYFPDPEFYIKKYLH